MGLAVASKKNSSVYLAIDSMYNGVIDVDSFKNIHNYQIVIINSFIDVHISYQGSEKKLIDLLKKEKDLFPKSCFRNGKIELSYLVNNFIPKIYELLETYKIIDSSDQSRYITGEIIIATKHQIFMVYMDGSVVEEHDFVAIGNSDTFAYGAYKAMPDLIDETDTLIRTFESVIQSSYKVKFPILIMEISNNKFEIIIERHKDNLYTINL